MRKVMFRLVSTPRRMLAVASAALLCSAVVGPPAVSKFVDDGGFARYGWKIDLSKWSQITADTAGQSHVDTDYVSTDTGRERTETRLNTGQSMVFRNVPATGATRFMVSARVHPQWNPGDALDDPVTFEAMATDGHETSRADVEVRGERTVSGQLQTLVVDLKPYAGRKVNIMIKPISSRSSVWTLWSDPQIVVK